MNKIYCLGEALIDMYGDEPRVGGAPANVAACVAKLGGNCAFVGGISTDEYGKSIFRTLADLGVDMTYAKRKAAPTAVAHVQLVGAERSFRFDRKNTADLALNFDDVRYIPFEEGDILHFCSNCLMDDNMRRLHARLIEDARSNGAIISYDVNLRPSLWQDEQTMLETATAFLSLADIVKVSAEEKRALFKDYGFNLPIRDMPLMPIGNIFDLCRNASCVIETKGADGGCAYLASAVFDHLIDERGVLDFFAENKSPVDATGAGDCFIGATLARLASFGLPHNRSQLWDALQFASEAAALSVSAYGAISSYPTLEEVLNAKFD